MKEGIQRHDENKKNYRRPAPVPVPVLEPEPEPKFIHEVVMHSNLDTNFKVNYREPVPVKLKYKVVTYSDLEKNILESEESFEKPEEIMNKFKISKTTFYKYLKQGKNTNKRIIFLKE
jgi:hypothetical protein